MIQRVTIAPPYSILFISGPEDFEIPDIPRESEVAIWSTPMCIVFGCRMFQDGETEVTLAPAADMHPDLLLRFDGQLETPNGHLEVSTAEGQIVFGTKVEAAKTRVRIWSDHPSEPDRVIIGLG